jgi:lipoate-protein ligase A
MRRAAKSSLIKSIFHFSKVCFSRIEIVHSDVNDIYFNLAIEENLYEHSELTHPILFLWRNDKTVVIGSKYS